MWLQYLSSLPAWKQIAWILSGFGLSYWSAWIFAGVDTLRRAKPGDQLFALSMMAVFGANGVFFLVLARMLMELLLAGKSA